MSEHNIEQKDLVSALETVRRGDFDEVLSALQKVGFQFKPGKDPNHLTYYHPLLREDPYFRYPRKLYRQHGSRRSSDRITYLDAQQAREMIRALQARAASEPKGDEDE